MPVSTAGRHSGARRPVLRHEHAVDTCGAETEMARLRRDRQHLVFGAGACDPFLAPTGDDLLSWTPGGWQLTVGLRAPRVSRG